MTTKRMRASTYRPEVSSEVMPAQQRTDEQVRQVLAQLSGSEPLGQELDPPPLHPFAARMPRKVAEHLVGALTGSGDTVLDPMAGSGTTLVAARRLGRIAVGVERDPLAVLIARTATRAFSSSDLAGLKQRILERARSVARKRERPLRMRESLPAEDRAFLKYWFPEESVRQLFSLAAAIRSEPDPAQRDFAWVVFSTLIIAKVAGASRALDLPRSRPHKDDAKMIVLPFDAWQRRFDAVHQRLPFADTAIGPEATIVVGDARALPPEVRTADLVLTSPPYLTAIDYLRGHKFSLVWMGHRIDALRALRGTMVGTERGLWTPDGLPPAIETRLEQEITPHRQRAILRRYLSDLRKILGEIERVLTTTGIAVVVAGPNIVASREPDAAAVVGHLANSVGLRVIGSATRALSVARRSLPPPSWMGQNPLALRMQHEVIIALRR
jgi:DNA modification methylase